MDRRSRSWCAGKSYEEPVEGWQEAVEHYSTGLRSWKVRCSLDARRGKATGVQDSPSGFGLLNAPGGSSFHSNLKRILSRLTITYEAKPSRLPPAHRSTAFVCMLHFVSQADQWYNTVTRQQATATRVALWPSQPFSHSLQARVVRQLVTISAVMFCFLNPSSALFHYSTAQIITTLSMQHSTQPFNRNPSSASL